MSKPSVGKAELSMIAEVFKSGWLGEGHITELFEKQLEKLTGAPHVIAVNTGTSALHLALYSLGISSGDEVILPSMTFVSDPMAVIMCGARPVFCDIDPETLNIDPRKIKPLLTSRTRAIMPTDFAGVPVDIPAIRRVIGKRDIKIIRDASHSFGSLIQGRHIGVWLGEDATCFSFDPIKNLTCGEGGAILVQDEKLAANLRCQKMLGMKRTTWQSLSKKTVEDRRVVQQGFRYHMSNINAAIGLAQLRQFKRFAARRRKLAKLYDQLLSKNSQVKIFKRDYDTIIPFMYIIRVKPEHRDDLIAYLAQNSIHAGLRYYPCHLQKFFGHQGRRLPVTEQLAREMLSIPLFPGLTEKQVRFVVSKIQAFFD
ncbi:MAG: DegT/DnrJ/EryC1/StrS family aminotransferase [Clostridia bacterium]|nr:DegT/DnrJ/EryC1/StrS family aminotransferase [Clostridia bacterium]